MFFCLLLRYVVALASLFFLVLISGVANAQAVIIPFGQPMPDVKVPMNFKGHKIPFSTVQPSVTPANNSSFSPSQARPSTVPMSIRPIITSPTYSSLGPMLALPIVGEVFGWAYKDIEKRLNAKYDKEKEQFYRDVSSLSIPQETEFYKYQFDMSAWLADMNSCYIAHSGQVRICNSVSVINHENGHFGDFYLDNVLYSSVSRVNAGFSTTWICLRGGYCGQHMSCCSNVGCSCTSSSLTWRSNSFGRNVASSASLPESQDTIFRNYGFSPNISEPLTFDLQDYETLPTLMYYWASLRDSSPATLEVEPLVSTFTDLQTNAQYQSEVAPVNNPIVNPYKSPISPIEPTPETATQPKTNANFDTKPMLEAMAGLQTALYAVVNGVRTPLTKTTLPTTISDAVGNAVKCPLCSMGGQILSSLSTLKNVMTAEQLASLLSGLTMTIQLQELNDNFEITDIEELSGVSVSDAALVAADTVKDMANLNTSTLQANIQNMLDSLPKPNIDLGIPNSGSCPSPDVIPLLGSSITIDYGAFCDVMDKYGDILKFFVMSLGVLIVSKQFFIKGNN